MTASRTDLLFSLLVLTITAAGFVAGWSHVRPGWGDAPIVIDARTLEAMALPEPFAEAKHGSRDEESIEFSTQDGRLDEAAGGDRKPAEAARGQRIERLEQALARTPDDPDLLARLGSLWLAEGRADRAVGMLERAVALDPERASAFYNLGLANARLGRTAEGREAYARALELRPGHGRTLYNLGVLELRAGRPGAAEQHFRRLVETDRSGRLTARTWFQLGRLAQEQGRLGEAVRAYRESIALRPAYASARNNLALALEDLGDRKGAITELRKALRLEPDLASARFNLGRLLRGEGQTGEALDHFRMALELEPDLVGAIRGTAEILEERDDWAAAAQVLERGARRSGRVDLLIDAGTAWRRARRYDEAERALRLATEQAPGSAAAWNGLGIALRKLGRRDEARRAYESALELSPDSISAWFNLGLLEESTGRVGRALEAFREVVVRRPGHAKARRHLVTLLTAANRCDEAIREAARLLSLAGNDPAIRELAATSFETCGRPRLALEARRSGTASSEKTAAATGPSADGELEILAEPAKAP